MATLQNLTFKTGVGTGTGQQDSFGQDLAKLLMVGAEAYTSVEETNRIAENRARQQQAENRAASNRDKADMMDRDYIRSIESSTKRNEWETEHGYATLESGAKSELDAQYYLQNPSLYETEKYQAGHDKEVSKRALSNSNLAAKEAFNSLNVSAQAIGDSRIKAGTLTEETLQTDMEQFKKINGNYKTKTYTTGLTNSILNDYATNQEAYRNLSMEEFKNKFDYTSAIKDKDLQKKITAMKDDYYVYQSVMKGGFFKDKDRVALNKNVVGLESKSAKYANIIVPGLLAGDDASVAQAINISKQFNLGDKEIIAENKQRLARYDTSFYNKTRDAVTYDEDTILKMRSIELVAAQNNIDTSTREGFQEMQAVFKANQGSKAFLGDKSVAKVWSDGVKAGMGEASFRSKEDMNAEWMFKRRYYESALNMANDEEQVFQMLDTLWEDSQIESLPVKYTGLKDEDDLEGFTEYLSKVAPGQSGAEIKANGTGFTITRLEGNREVTQFVDRAGLKLAVDDYRTGKKSKTIIDGAKNILDKKPVTKKKEFQTMEDIKAGELAAVIKKESETYTSQFTTKGLPVYNEVLFNVGQMSKRANKVKLTQTQVNEANSHMTKAINKIGHKDKIKEMAEKLGVTGTVDTNFFKGEAKKVITGLYSKSAGRLSNRDEQINSELEMSSSILVDLADMELGGDAATIATNVTSEYHPDMRKAFEKEVYETYMKDIIDERPSAKKKAFARALVDAKQDKIDNLKAFMLQEGPTDQDSLDKIERLFNQINGYNTAEAMGRDLDTARLQLFKERLNAK